MSLRGEQGEKDRTNRARTANISRITLTGHGRDTVSGGRFLFV
nr:MAG TPA: hypothetical protein [Bacteriophage sp.]